MTFAQEEVERHMELVGGRRWTWEEIYHGLVFEQLVPHPPLPYTPDLLARCEACFDRHVAPGDGRVLEPEALREIPVWVFLDYLVRHRGMLVHGSGRSDIESFEPRVTRDTFAGGEIPKIYAASSGVMAMFYAILDGERLWELPCLPARNVLYVRWTDNGEGKEGYWFTIDHRAVPYAPWRAGTMYVLPREPFTPDYQEMQWYSTTAVRPLVRISVRPEDFPLLHEVRGADWFEDARREVAGAPFRDDPVLYPPVQRPSYQVR
jgi:hypothetical protein